jgi:hypothetical protein
MTDDTLDDIADANAFHPNRRKRVGAKRGWGANRLKKSLKSKIKQAQATSARAKKRRARTVNP